MRSHLKHFLATAWWKCSLFCKNWAFWALFLENVASEMMSTFWRIFSFFVPSKNKMNFHITKAAVKYLLLKNFAHMTEIGCCVAAILTAGNVLPKNRNFTKLHFVLLLTFLLFFLWVRFSLFGSFSFGSGGNSFKDQIDMQKLTSQEILLLGVQGWKVAGTVTNVRNSEPNMYVWFQIVAFKWYLCIGLFLVHSNSHYCPQSQITMTS